MAASATWHECGLPGKAKPITRSRPLTDVRRLQPGFQDENGTSSRPRAVANLKMMVRALWPKPLSATPKRPSRIRAHKSAGPHGDQERRQCRYDTDRKNAPEPQLQRMGSVFGDDKLTTDLFDRLTHRCHILETGSDNFRRKGRRSSALDDAAVAAPIRSKGDDGLQSRPAVQWRGVPPAGLTCAAA